MTSVLLASNWLPVTAADSANLGGTPLAGKSLDSAWVCDTYEAKYLEATEQRGALFLPTHLCCSGQTRLLNSVAANEIHTPRVTPAEAVGSSAKWKKIR
jgi:hypothetical protein